MKQRMDWTKIMLFSAAGIVAAILGASLSLLIFGASPQPAARGEGQALIGGAFDLVDVDGAARNEEMLLGETSLVYFGFTYCPDFCPTELANLAAVKRRLQSTGDDVQIIFITVDPERDTKELLKDYVAYFHEDIVGLTGSLDQVTAAAQAFRVYFEKVDDPDYPGEYTMNHTTLVYAMGPDGRYVAHFGAATPPETIVEELTKARAGG